MKQFNNTLDFPICLSPNLAFHDDIDYYIDFSKFEIVKYFKMIFDEKGIPLINYGPKIGLQRNYLFVVLWGIYCLQKYIREKNSIYLSHLKTQAQWIVDNAVINQRQGTVWYMYYPWKERGLNIKAPWAGAMGQGMTISFLVRVYRLFKDNKAEQIIKDAHKIFRIDVLKGGVRTEENGLTFYEEYPTSPPLRILDGFLVALLGLYDHFDLTRDDTSLRLFHEGIFTLEKTLDTWNYRNLWSWYYPGEKLCCRFYNKFNVSLLQAIYGITKVEKFKVMASYWQPNKPFCERTPIYWRWFYWKVKTAKHSRKEGAIQ